MLSESEATAIGSTVSGSGTNIASAYGTSTTSDMNPPPSRPANGPSPYIAINGSEPHELVTPRRHSRQVPQLSWNGTTTRSPALNPETESPTATTSAMPSCPTAYPGGSGAAPRATATSRSQQATAKGRTNACCGWVISGSATSRHAYRPASSNVNCLIPAFLSECSSIVNSVPRPDRSRAALIDTAATLFRRQGYAATGLNQILDEAAVKPGSLYHHFPRGKQQLAAAVVDGTGAAIEQLLRRFLAGGQPVADIVDRWVALLAAGLTADRRDGCPIEPIATESVNASALVREASARAFTGWCTAIEERLRADGWSATEAESVAVAVISLIEGALILSRIAGDVAALEAAKPAARRLLCR